MEREWACWFAENNFLFLTLSAIAQSRVAELLASLLAELRSPQFPVVQNCAE